jgi:hypothetical protein
MHNVTELNDQIYLKPINHVNVSIYLRLLTNTTTNAH